MKKPKFYQTWQFNMWSTILIIVLPYSIYFFYYPAMEYIKRARYDINTTGILVNYEAQKTMYHGYEGGTYTTVKNYIVYYQYRVNGQTLSGKDILPGKFAIGVTLKNISRSSQKLIKLKYQSESPGQSIVVL